MRGKLIQSGNFQVNTGRGRPLDSDYTVKRVIPYSLQHKTRSMIRAVVDWEVFWFIIETILNKPLSYFSLQDSQSSSVTIAIYCLMNCLFSIMYWQYVVWFWLLRSVLFSGVCGFHGSRLANTQKSPLSVSENPRYIWQEKLNNEK